MPYHSYDDIPEDNSGELITIPNRSYTIQQIISMSQQHQIVIEPPSDRLYVDIEGNRPIQDLTDIDSLSQDFSNHVQDLQNSSK